MRACWPMLLLLPCVTISCSCERRADDDHVATTTAAPVPAAAAEPASAAAPDTAAATPGADARAARARQQAASTVQRYLGLLPAADRSGADALWAGGRPPPRADDAVLREMADIRSLRIETDRPQPLDREDPPRALEVPVRLRLHSDGGSRRLQGWYRVRAKIGGDGWEITSASLQPQLD